MCKLLVICVAAALACLVSACTTERETQQSPVVVDSAGVRIVTNSALELPRLTLRQTPRLVLGEEDTADEPLFRVVAGLFLGEATIVVANGGSDEIHLYTRDGQLRHVAGGTGNGPGEFQSIGWLQAYGDTAFVVGDDAQGRMTLLSALGDLKETRRFLLPTTYASSQRAILGRGGPWALLPDGRIVAFPVGIARTTGTRAELPARAAFHVYSVDQSTSTEIDSVTVITWFEVPTADGPRLESLYGAARLRTAARDEVFAYTDGLAHNINVLVGGHLTLQIRETRSRIPLQVDSLPSGYNHAVDFLPAYEDLRIDADGRIWVRAPTGQPGTEPIWRVFAGSGSATAEVVLPAAAILLDARGSDLLLLRRDELDVETVEIWELMGLSNREHS